MAIGTSATTVSVDGASWTNIELTGLNVTSTTLSIIFTLNSAGFFINSITIEYESSGSTETTNYTVQWKVGGQAHTAGDPTTSVKSGEKVSTLPTRPANNAIGSCADTFMGWSAHNLGSKTGQDAPKDLFTTAEGSPVITQDTTFYAVFATKKQQ